MNEKIINVFFDANCLPYKDTERQVHFPIVGGAFLGASDTTKIRFYFDRIGNSNTTWVAVAKLPNGKQGSKVLSISVDSELGENYAELSLDNWFTQAKGDVYIALQGYQGGVEYSYDSETELYEITGTPTIQTTGSIKLAINYAPIGDSPDYTDEFTTYQEILAGLGDKADISSTIIVVNDITQVVATTYEDGQIFYNLADRKLYQLNNSSFVVFQPYVVISSEPIPQSDFDIILAHKEYPILYGSYVFWYYGEDTLALRYARNDLDVSSNTFTTTKQQLIIFKNTREYDLLTQNAETYKKSKIDTELSSKADKSTTYTKTETDDLLNNKQNTLVSGTNIKSLTVDGVEKSLLGSGTIEVGTGGGGGAWGEITGDIQDQTDLQAEFQDIREVAEGKCKTLIIRYSTTAPTTDLGVQMYKKVDGTRFTNLTDFNSYIGARTIANASFNSQSNGLTLSNYYIIGEDLIAYRDSDLPSIFNAGDIILVIEVDVPDRWIQMLFSNTGFLYKLETSKIDLDNYATKTEVAQKSDLSNIAPEYDSDTTYAVGDKVIHDGKLYTCNTTITTPESWDSTHWTQVSVASGFVDLDKEQVISGVKRFTGGTITDSARVLYLRSTGDTAPIYSRSDFVDLNNGTHSLGTSSYTWKDLYLSGNINFATTKIYEDANNRLAFYENGDIRWLILTDGTLRPYNTNQNDIGTSNSKVKDIYLSGVAYTGTIRNNATISLDTIGTGGKVRPSIDGTDLGDSTHTWGDLYLSGNIILGSDSNITASNLVINGNGIRPLYSNVSNLGLQNRRWQAVFVGNELDFTSSSTKILNHATNTTYGLTLPDTTNFTANKEIATTDQIDVVTITLSQTETEFTQDMLDILNANKILKVNGTVATFVNPVLFKTHETGTDIEGIMLCKNTVRSFRLRTNGTVASSSVSIPNLGAVNGKNLPPYPANTGTFNIQCVNGTLAWNEQWYGTQAEYDALTSYDSNTTYNILES